jgi:hypothetical protein
MIVLDEQLSNETLKMAIARWHKGQVTFIKLLRSRTLINDDEIPALLRRLKQPTFVTINWPDFWKKLPVNHHYCLICFAIDLDRRNEIPSLLRQVLKLKQFNTKARRMGVVMRVTKKAVHYYRINDPKVYTLSI